jgi:hypothetical protein
MFQFGSYYFASSAAALHQSNCVLQSQGFFGQIVEHLFETKWGFRFMSRLALSLVFVLGSIVSVSAQSFDEVVSAAQGAVGDMAKYQEALQNPDQRFQYAMIQQMLKLPDPALQRIAKEHALFSTNPVMRQAAIKAILDSGATLRIQFAGVEEGTTNIRNFILRSGGTYSTGKGAVLITVPAAVSDACWGNANACFFKQVGNSLQYTPGGYITSVMDLGNDGILRGTVSYGQDETMQIQIDLKE